ncbi:DEAD/DEAH box helicase [Cohnella lubricantis]|uniref:DEAD/DEAH box helicase n=2 Tax=Cohnella lubricantis TaxID=2163172 RepID=A0A841TGM9_9BACL|nr:DEAD/DEAH box helicase [Cohnella lubricantis]
MPPSGDTNIGEAAGAFKALGLNERLAAKLAEAGMTGPTAVQADAIPPLIGGSDGMLRSPTGTGKTLAYLLPVLQRIDASRRETQAVIMAPTQELAMQIVRVAETYGEPLGVQTVALIGGAALSRQLERMKRKPQLVVGTPGRVREVASLKKLPLHAVRMVVVDETDRVFSLGGRTDVESILRGASRERQTVFVSATRSEAMREAESKWLRNPWVSEAVDEGSANGLPQTIEHGFIACDMRDKVDMVRRLARNLKPAGALVFVNDIERIGELLSKLRYEGFAADALYGDTPGRERGEVLRRFREGKTKLLIATDVAARGLDIPGLPLVIQFEPALDADHYVHRAGRTGRMGRSGRSISLIAPQEKFIMNKLGKRLGIEIAELALSEGRLQRADEPRRQGRSGSAGGRGDKRERGAIAPARGGAVGKPGAGGAADRPQAGYAAGPIRAADERPAGAGRARGLAAEAPRAGEAARKPEAAKPGQASKAKAKADRKRDNKNKGAPRWLKEKRNQAEPPPAP